MQCPSCHFNQTKVIESRTTEKAQSIRRRRECLQCHHRFTTYERIEFVAITVIKKDGSTESFDRSKVLRGIVRACEKTGIESELLDSIVDNLESEIENQFPREITSKQIGNLVLKQLSQISQVAYIRFASVYENFTSIEDFVATLKKLQNSPENSGNNPEPQSPISENENKKNQTTNQ
ncbi:transcriptional regulator NrdR [Cyanobacterium aponinum UTEX 3222]|uniref:Transcriptional repressor NrdR n=3 Tax=Cyanobacterium aponinum TaxID=379064 RepID=K9Z6M5_CYAAP|nr:transcriptional regulator NrdR [Cyanobacterium aponinum]WRL43652.1 transcriptional regulator NrdR [Cyanobacterium aponinum UTEX 3222]AFZ54402.1 Transcriptional repressor nrdR [Cyanobacterium aponinum PCC 10605]MBD2394082.1 transcriptional repressor NrdR [Cyanobacterium aponinum FACHB-4101]MTF38776.1 transcriptional repressor NrdR [Cyanobacterium aponinum 0216]PHV62556.1 transcriptional repressor NrdR [Cyanobacterium aponinum IPPAS B-1201]